MIVNSDGGLQLLQHGLELGYVEGQRVQIGGQELSVEEVWARILLHFTVLQNNKRYRVITFPIPLQCPHLSAAILRRDFWNPKLALFRVRLVGNPLMLRLRSSLYSDRTHVTFIANMNAPTCQ
jgi:hypothetical protein